MSILLGKVSVHDICSHLTAEAEALLETKNKDNGGPCWKVEVDPKSRENITTDKTRLYQILNNFLTNAIKFTAKGEVKFRTIHQNDKISFCMVDTGKGIPFNRQRDIFYPFIQVDEFEDRKKGGVGLGLAITKKLAGLLKGKIGLVSTVNKGTTISITIPYE